MPKPKFKEGTKVRVKKTGFLAVAEGAEGVVTQPKQGDYLIVTFPAGTKMRDGLAEMEQEFQQVAEEAELEEVGS